MLRLNPIVMVAGQAPQLEAEGPVRFRVTLMSSGLSPWQWVGSIGLSVSSPTPAPHHSWASIPTFINKLSCSLTRCGGPGDEMVLPDPQGAPLWGVGGGG